MTASISFTEAQVRAALRALLLDVLPGTIEVVKGQDNRVGVPKTSDFVTLTLQSRERLSTNRTVYASTVKNVTQPTAIGFQVDVFGPNAGDNVEILMTVVRDGYAFDFFRDQGIDARITDLSEPRQLPWTTGEDQYETRWSIDLTVQANMVVGLSQSSATTVAVTPILGAP